VTTDTIPTETTPVKPGSVNLLDILTADRVMPEGRDMWAIRSVRPDLRSSRGYRWPYPGGVAVAPGPFYESNSDGCPKTRGDGICVATSWRGMASGSIPARTLLLCAIRTADILGTTPAEQKHRVREALVVDLIDGEKLLVEQGAGADLAGADLRGADLAGADLRGADLAGADLSGADLADADLTDADLTGANLTGANLAGANLTDADLAGAYLTGANLTDANLTHANLTRANLADANLTDANLTHANLTDANLTDANLTRANLTDANLTRARSDRDTIWPTGFDTATAGVTVEATP
jgi:hypothetical protein